MERENDGGERIGEGSDVKRTRAKSLRDGGGKDLKGNDGPEETLQKGR